MCLYCVGACVNMRVWVGVVWDYVAVSGVVCVSAWCVSAMSWSREKGSVPRQARVPVTPGCRWDGKGQRQRLLHLGLPGPKGNGKWVMPAVRDPSLGPSKSACDTPMPNGGSLGFCLVMTAGPVRGSVPLQEEEGPELSLRPVRTRERRVARGPEEGARRRLAPPAWPPGPQTCEQGVCSLQAPALLPCSFRPPALTETPGVPPPHLAGHTCTLWSLLLLPAAWHALAAA